MNLKEHNDIVEKLLKKMDAQQSEITMLQKQLHKAQAPKNLQKVGPSEKQQKLNKKLENMNKQHKQRVSQLTQQLSAKNNQNKQLKDRLTSLQNQQSKKQQQVSQILKKSSNISSYDHKFASVVSHYESQIEKKNKHIEALQKQIKESYYSQNNKHNQIDDQQNSMITRNSKQSKNEDSVLKVKEQQINFMRSQMLKYRKLFEEKDRQFKDLTKKYGQLTRDYYKIINQYGCDQKKPNKIVNKQINNPQPNKFMKSKTGIKQILQQMAQSEFDQDQSVSFSISTQYKPNKVNQNQLGKLEHIIDQILQILNIQSRAQIIPHLTKMCVKLENVSILSDTCRELANFMYRLGMGKVQQKNLVNQLPILQERVNKYIQEGDLLNQICLEAGAKKDRVIDKIKDLKATSQEFFNNLKNVRFMHQLPKANKIIQFIDYFQLDREACQLPNQLKKIYQQLRYVQKFMKQSNIILDRPNQSMEKCFEGIIRYLQKKQSEQYYESQNKFKSAKLKK